MADQINPQNYNNMIEALNKFASKTTTTSDELRAACSQCASILGESDVGAMQLASNASQIAVKYHELAVEARRIAAAMQAELTEYYNREHEIWRNSDYASDDFD